jgi:CheY-like chemotaxis protein
LSAVSKSWALAAPTPAILLVDDDPFLAHARTAALETRHERVVRAAGAAEAFILVDQPTFARDLALVVVALHMPGLSGPMFVAELNSRTPGVPVLVLCRPGECTEEYAAENAHLLPHSSPLNEMLRVTDEILKPAVLPIA